MKQGFSPILIKLDTTNLITCSHQLLIVFFTLVLEEDTQEAALLSGEELFVPGYFRLVEDISAWQTIMVIIIKWGIT